MMKMVVEVLVHSNSRWCGTSARWRFCFGCRSGCVFRSVEVYVAGAWREDGGAAHERWLTVVGKLAVDLQWRWRGMVVMMVRLGDMKIEALLRRVAAGTVV